MIVDVAAAAAAADAATGVLVIAVAAVIVVIEVQGVNAIDGCGGGAWREGWMELWAVWVASGSTIVMLVESTSSCEGHTIFSRRGQPPAKIDNSQGEHPGFCDTLTVGDLLVPMLPSNNSCLPGVAGGRR